MNEQDLLRLSAYLDNELSTAEQAALEARLQSDPALRFELDSLRQVSQLLHELPILQAPHNYILPPQVARRSPPPLVTWRVMVPALAAALVLVVFGAVFLLAGGQDASAPLDTAAEKSLPTSAVEIAEQATFIATLADGGRMAATATVMLQEEAPAPLPTPSPLSTTMPLAAGAVAQSPPSPGEGQQFAAAPGAAAASDMVDNMAAESEFAAQADEMVGRDDDASLERRRQLLDVLTVFLERFQAWVLPFFKALGL